MSGLKMLMTWMPQAGLASGPEDGTYAYFDGSIDFPDFLTSSSQEKIESWTLNWALEYHTLILFSLKEPF